MLDNVELWWNYGWNYMKFHPNSTRNSTTYKYLIICALTTTRWKGGITNDSKRIRDVSIYTSKKYRSSFYS